MIAYVLAQGDALRPGVADKIVGDLTDAIYRGLPATSLKALLESESTQARTIGIRVAFMCGPYVRSILEDIRALTGDDNPEIRKCASETIRQLA